MNDVKEKWNKVFTDGSYYHMGLESEVCGILTLNPGARFALDIGCGKGELASYLSDKGLDVLGVDVSDVAIKHAREKSKAKFKVADIESLVLNTEYDLIFCKFVYAFIKDKQKLIDLVAQSLRENGLFVVISPVALGDEQINEAVSFDDIKVISNKFNLVFEKVIFQDSKNKLSVLVYKYMSHPEPTQDYPCENCEQQPDDCECEVCPSCESTVVGTCFACKMD